MAAPEIHTFPEEKQRQLRKARNVEWLMIVWQMTVIVFIYLVMGSSQAMKGALVDDLLIIIPPVVFLIALGIRQRGPNERFPYGYARAPILSFLAASTAILVLGIYIFLDSSLALFNQDRPSLGHFDLFGWHVWIGWAMIAALIYSAIPSLLLGPIKLKLARELHDKTLHADAVMNKADWMTSAAAILGILGIGIGLWWADAVAAIAISLDIIKDGAVNLRSAMCDLMDHRPSSVDRSKPLELDGKIIEEVRQFEEVEAASVRLRESGNLITGEIFVQLRNQSELAHLLHEIGKKADATDWRLYDLAVIPVEAVQKN